MTGFRATPPRGLFVLLALSGLGVASCHSSFTSSAFVPASTNSKMSTYTRGLQAPQTRVNVVPQCSFNKLPGSFVTVVTDGNVHNGTYTPAPAGTGANLWERYYAKSTGMPTPKPTPSPTHPPYYFYLGTYTDKLDGVVDTVGCASFLTTQDGSPLPVTHGKYNAEDV